MTDLLTRGSAEISPCGQYRYRLERFWSGEHALPFVMLNPSTADATENDNTIRRCMRFAQDNGFGGIIVCNLFAYRATSPDDMKATQFPVGPLNDERLNQLFIWAKRADVPVIAAWGTHGSHRNRDQTVMSFARLAGCDFRCLGETKSGAPMHPLYRPADHPFLPYPAQGMSAGTDETAIASVQEVNLQALKQMDQDA